MTFERRKILRLYASQKVKLSKINLAMVKYFLVPLQVNLTEHENKINDGNK
jgi:hypothetical protein